MDRMIAAVLVVAFSGSLAWAQSEAPAPGQSDMPALSEQYFLDRAYALDYRHAQLTAAWAPRPDLDLRLLFHVPDANARRLFGDAADRRVEAALQVSF